MYLIYIQYVYVLGYAIFAIYLEIFYAVIKIVALAMWVIYQMKQLVDS